jgi:hypothetical protein
MGGGLMQLVAYGAQDIYLTGQPEITFFKVVYRRHTNFSIEVMEVPIDNARFGGQCNTQILRNGDLASKVWMRVKLPDITGANVTYDADETDNGKIAWIRRLGHALIKTLKLDIGGTEIDKNLGIWMDIWYELSHTYDQERGYREKIGDVPAMTALAGPTTASSSEVVIKGRQLYIPLQFWFCRNYGLSLPLIALQYHEVRIRTEYQDLTRLILWSGATAPNMSSYQISDAAFMVDYVFLDNVERKRFAQVGHEYLIEQVQFTSEETITGSATSSSITQQYKLSFNHPCKEIVWALSVGAFNGEANRSTFSGSRGRFLAYTETDDWADAMNYAALNLATGMLVPDDVAGGTHLTNHAIVADNSSESRAITVAVTATHNIVVDITMHNDSGAAIAAGTVWASIFTSVMVKDAFNLCTELDEVQLIVDAAAGPVFTIRANSIVVVEHHMLIRDVSIPVEDWTDTRQTLVAGKCSWDVTVIQLNYGLELNGTGNPVNEGKIQLNGHDRFLTREGAYFNYIQTENHTRTPADGINVYCFGLHPEQHQPSGTANLSRIDTTMLIIKFSDCYRSGITGVPSLDYVKDSKFLIFAFSYNVLRVMSGMGGLAYSN